MNSYQAHFHAKWGYLHDPHVRALAWLLDSPALLDASAPQWKGQIAVLGEGAGERERAWLSELDKAPSQLHAYLDVQPFLRLGRYAEKLMAFYFSHRGNLVAHGVQVRDENGSTIGEFDFLLRDKTSLAHWEFATKLYLLEPTGVGLEADYFVGPNLADTLGAKMRKIFQRQLSLSSHPAAHLYLPEPVLSAQALVKGWLFYRDESSMVPTRLVGVSASHCRGFWRTLAELDAITGDRFVVLPRLSWLAPARVEWERVLNKQALQDVLADYFHSDKMPVLVAIVAREASAAIETGRGFIVPNDWRIRAGLRSRPADKANT